MMHAHVAPNQALNRNVERVFAPLEKIITGTSESSGETNECRAERRALPSNASVRGKNDSVGRDTLERGIEDS